MENSYSYIPKYTKEEAESFNKLINRNLTSVLQYPYITMLYETRASAIQVHLNNEDYYKYIIEMAKLLDDVALALPKADNSNKTISYDWFMHKPLEEMPLYINGSALINKLAVWRLKIGK